MNIKNKIGGIFVFYAILIRGSSLSSVVSSVNSTDANFAVYLLYNQQLTKDFLVRDDMAKTITQANQITIQKLRFVQEYINICLRSISQASNPQQRAVLEDIYMAMQNIALGYFAEIDTAINKWLAATAPIRSDFIHILRFMNTKLTTTPTEIVGDSTFGKIIFFNNDFNLDILNHVRAQSVVDNYLGFLSNSLSAARALLSAADKNLDAQNPTQAAISNRISEFLVRYSDAAFTVFSTGLKNALKQGNIAYVDQQLFGSKNYSFVMIYEFVSISEAYVNTGL